MTNVIINDILPLTQAIATGGQTVYSTNWTADAASDVVVYSRASNIPADDVTQILPTSAYTVAFIGASRIVQVTLLTPSTLSDVVTITRQTPADRVNIYNNTNFTPSMLNNDFGILTLVDQQSQLVNQQLAPRYNYSELLNLPEDIILPALGASQFWAKNSSNSGFEALDVTSGGGGSVTQIDTGTGLTGGPITSFGTISFAPIAANSFWANNTGGVAVPSVIPLTTFLVAANNLSDLTNKPLARTNLGVAIGTDVEAWSPALDSIAALVTSANQLLRTTGSNTYATIAAAASAVLVTSAGSVPSLSQTLPTAVQSNITQLGAQSQNLDMNSNKIVNLTDPTAPQDAATRAYVLSQTTGAFLPLSGGTMSGAINMGNNQINAMADPSSSQDAVTLSYLNTQLGLKLSLSGGTMTGAINMGSHFITNLLDPVNPQDAATRNYVDLVATGLTVQPAVFAASTGALTATYNNGASGIGATLTNAGAFAVFALDSTNPTATNRVLIKNQASTFQNGIYTVTNVGDAISVNWVLTRATDYDQPAEIQPGDLIIVNNGTVNAGTSFIETASVSVIGTDPILFSQFTFSATAVLLKANNLSDVANITTAFNNISPLTTKGDLIGFSTQNIRVAVGGTNTQVLQVDSSAAAGISWSTATYPKTTTVNQILYSSATNTVVGLATSAGAVLVTDAIGVPSLLANPSATGKVLQSVSGAIPAWSTPTYPSVSGTSGKHLVSDGTNVIYSTPTFPIVAGAAGNVFISDGTNYVASTSLWPNTVGTSGKVVISNGTSNVYSTPTFPNASATTRKIIVSDGTNWVASTETYAVPGTSGNVLTSDGTNWLSSTPASTVLLTTKGDLFGFSTVDARVPVASGNGKILQVDSTASVGLSYSTATYPVTAGTSGNVLTSDGTNWVSSAPTGGGTVNSSTQNNLAYYAANGTAVSGLATANSGFLVTDGSGVPSISSTVPAFTTSSITFSPTTNGIVGTTTNDNAAAGKVGEFLSTTSGNTAVSTGTAVNISSVSLTAGDWDVWGCAISVPASGTVTSRWIVAISTTSATIPANTPTSAVSGYSSNASAANAVIQQNTGVCRISLASTTTVYLVVVDTHSVSTMQGNGWIAARRRR